MLTKLAHFFLQLILICTNIPFILSRSDRLSNIRIQCRVKVKNVSFPDIGHAFEMLLDNAVYLTTALIDGLTINYVLSQASRVDHIANHLFTLLCLLHRKLLRHVIMS